MLYSKKITTASCTFLSYNDLVTNCYAKSFLKTGQILAAVTNLEGNNAIY